MKSPEQILFAIPPKAEKKREKKRIRKTEKALRKEMKTMCKAERILPEAYMAEMLVGLADIRTNIDSMIQFIAGVR